MRLKSRGFRVLTLAPPCTCLQQYSTVKYYSTVQLRTAWSRPQTPPSARGGDYIGTASYLAMDAHRTVLDSRVQERSQCDENYSRYSGQFLKS